LGVKGGVLKRGGFLQKNWHRSGKRGRAGDWIELFVFMVDVVLDVPQSGDNFYNCTASNAGKHAYH